MKLRSKAGVPIGIIAIIIIVLIAGIGMWWYFTRDPCAQYDDVVRSEMTGYDAYADVDHPYTDINFVQIQYETDTLDWDLVWRTSPGGTYAMGSLTFDELPSVIRSYLDGKQEDIGMHIWNAIDKGCV